MPLDRPCSSFGHETRFREVTKLPYNSTSDHVNPFTTTANNRNSYNKSISFTLASRFSDHQLSTRYQSSNGPGSYDINKGHLFSSEHPIHNAIRFASSPRKLGLPVQTHNSGAMYQIDNQYTTGPHKRYPIGFSKEVRFPETKLIQTMAPLFIIPSSLSNRTSRVITMGKKLPYKIPSYDTPGPIYNVHVRNMNM